ncbi:MAG TPA: thioredoxin family protein [Vicinamibacteria bacterium]
MSPITMRAAALGAALFLAAPLARAADRTQVFSIQGAESLESGERIKAELKKIAGVKKATFDGPKAELTVRLADGVADDAVLAAVARSGFKAVAGGGQGVYAAGEAFPGGADVVVLSKDGAAVGPFEKLRVRDKYTVFDLYAEWCGPCKLVDARLREILASRKDVAVRKLNVVDFDSPLARQMGPGFEALPYVVVYTPTGKKTEITGLDLQKLDKALASR